MKKFSFMAFATFAATLLCCFALTEAAIRHKLNADRLYMKSLILEKSNNINVLIPRLLYKTQILKTLIVQGNGAIDSFEEIAEIIVDEPSILNMLIAPDGVVSEIYPLDGNEAVLGIDLLAEETNGSKETNIAKDNDEFVFSGPINIIQGGQALVGRQPIFLKDKTAEDGKRFWGIISITLRYKLLLKEAGLDTIERLGYEYELWRVNPDDGEKQIIASSISEDEKEYFSERQYIERHMKVIDADWWLRVYPLPDVFDYAETWIMLMASVCISSMAALLIQRNRELKNLKSVLESMAYTDELTGAFNRRYFLEAANLRINRLKYTKKTHKCAKNIENVENAEGSVNDDAAASTFSDAFIILFDVDNFKQINDIHGHKAGDLVLREVAGIAGGMIRPYDLFARFGGDEFVIFIMDANEKLAVSVAERILKSFSQKKFDFSESISASFGIAPVLPCYGDAEAIIALADVALYAAKKKGRGRVECYNPSHNTL